MNRTQPNRHWRKEEKSGPTQAMAGAIDVGQPMADAKSNINYHVHINQKGLKKMLQVKKKNLPATKPIILTFIISLPT